MEAREMFYHNAIVYELDVAKFYDANGDGVGDFRGLTARLDYLEYLGANCLWLAPFYPSGGHDDGYDVTDFYSVDPRFGTLGDFVEFIQETRARGMYVIVDLVLNHTSDRHPWFQQARCSRQSPYRDYYVWVDDPSRFPPQKSAFPGEVNDVWTYDEEAKQYYFHHFYRSEPGLNHGNPAVREEIRRIVMFWLALGVSGLRIDAAPFLIMPKGPAQHFEHPHQLLRDIHRYAVQRQPNAILVGEVNVPPDELKSYFGQFQLIFNFVGTQRAFLALAREDAHPLAEVRKIVQQGTPGTQWLNFLRHHDELNLGWLSEKERHEVFDAFAPDPDTHIYGRGVRRRLAPMLNGDPSRLRLAFSLLFSRAGVPLVYYGDEIGMGDDLSVPGRAAVRVLMQWSDGANGGFSQAPAEELVRSPIPVGNYGYRRVNVTQARLHADSLLQWLRQLISIRRECPEIGHGAHREIDTEESSVLADYYCWKGSELLCLHNLSGTAKNARVDRDVLAGKPCFELLATHGLQNNVKRGADFALEPYGCRWYRLGELFPPRTAGLSADRPAAEGRPRDTE